MKLLEDIREQWEKGLEVLQVFDMRVTHGSIIIVLSQTDELTSTVTFKVLTYFKIGENWEVSCDLEAGNVIDVLSALNKRLS